MIKIIVTLKSIFVLLLVIVIISCQTAPSTAGNTSDILIAQSNGGIQNILVKKAIPQKMPGVTEPFPLPNCGGTGKLSQALGTQVVVSKSVGLGVSVLVNGGAEVAIPETAKVSIEAAV